ncbi:hypothetical protein K2173_002595 [Erythroxylum novogranatense]|uniref:non-specific serine/threonine protein kinase n=1 Tax=Erythroxylum novogranatense TaxID=1862640 RepID=A0AAV8TR00_9ROSI|nr:hypothetical protein K2173_002595 [Erythroxylum novogranatense]
MMEGMNTRILRTGFDVILCLFILVQLTCAQPGFVSIASCAESSFKDNNGIKYTSDNGIFQTDSTKWQCHDAFRAALNDTTYGKVRVFYIHSEKICYKLPTTPDSDYLIRGTFLSSDSVRTSVSSFDVLIGVTPIDAVNSSKEVEVVEGIFRATEQNIDFCLAYDKGDPYISQLELRPLNNSKYFQGNATTVLHLIARIDVGNNGADIRYPVDEFDRIWTSPDPETLPPSASVLSTPLYIPDRPVPSQVLQTALYHPDRLEFQHNDLDTQEYNYVVFLYFYELNASVQKGQRVFDIYINNEIKLDRFDILANGSKYIEVPLNVAATGSLNLTLARLRNVSDFGPILNAYEILQVKTWVQGTNQRDVEVINNVADELLEHNKEIKMSKLWFGDPCLPTSWEGLTCNNINGSSVISKLDLSANNLVGAISASIPQLPYLNELNLSNNDLTSYIPSFPASSMLKIVDLRNNDLQGSLPDSLLQLPQLATLYYGCNLHLSSELPSSFNRSGVTTDSGACDDFQESQSSKHGIVIGTAASGSVLFTVAVGIVVVHIYRRRFRAKRNNNGKRFSTTNVVFSVTSKDDLVVKSITIQMFTLEYIESATQKYKILIGEGGFGSVYRGKLHDGQEVAVKVRSSTSTQGTREFENELNLLSAFRHENLVPLLGYCSENDQQILVYPFMSNGSLQDRLYGQAAKRKILDWPTRLSIALGAARGLAYLHTFAGRCVIHRDVKSSNILLDHSMNARVADFGFSKYAPQEGDSGASLEVRGTAGYMDPEYYSTQRLSAKSDVFSFGVVLLEIVSGREPLNVQRPRNEWSLVEWAKPFIRESRIDEIVDLNIKGGYHVEAMWRVVEVALACIEPFSAYRPCMADIVRELEDALIIENNASEYMKSIDSIGGYSLGGSNRFSIALDKKIPLSPPAPTPPEPSPINTQVLAPPEPR